MSDYTGELEKYLAAERLKRGHGPHAQDVKTILRCGAFVGSSIDYLASASRTMDVARDWIDQQEKSDQPVKNGRVIIADSLHGCKGRFERSWHAPHGGLWGCLVHADTLLPRSAMLLSLAIGVAACEAMHEFGGKGASLRWVNDILFGDKKVAGFLIETYHSVRWKESFQLIGFGINLNNSLFPDELVSIATSLREEVGEQIDISAFFHCFVVKLIWNIGLLHFYDATKPQWSLEAENTVHPIVAAWLTQSDSVGRDVVFGHDVIENPQFYGRVEGLTCDGGLRLLVENGQEVVEYSGEIRYRRGFRNN